MKEWCDLKMSVSGIVLQCASGLSEWSLSLDSCCMVERVRNPFELFSFAESSSSSGEDEKDENDDDEEEEEEEEEDTGKTSSERLLESMAAVDDRRRRRSLKHVSRRNLSCLRIIRMEEEDDGQNKCSFEQIVGLQSLRDCEKLRVNLQNIIDLAIESELDQLMIFADDNLDASASKD